MSPSSKKIKVLSVTYGFIDVNRGTPIRIRNLIQGLSAYPDCEVHVATLDDSLPITSVSHIKLPRNKFKAIKLLSSYVFKNNIDVLVGHTLLCYSLILAVKVITRKKVILEMHGFIEDEDLLAKKISNYKYRLLKFKHNRIYKFFDLITTCSDTATDILRRHNSNVVTIFGGCDVKLFNPEAKREFNFKTNENELVIGYAGNTRIWQGLDFLLEVFSEIHTKDQTFKLALLLSEPTQLKELPGVSIISSLEHHRVPNFLNSCDVLIIPRLKNRVNDISFPSKLPEYLAMGKPVVASYTSDTFKIIDDGESGVLFEPGNKQELIDKLIILKDKNFRDKLSKNARYLSESKLNWTVQVAILYKQLTNLKEHE